MENSTAIEIEDVVDNARELLVDFKTKEDIAELLVSSIKMANPDLFPSEIRSIIEDSINNLL